MKAEQRGRYSVSSREIPSAAPPTPSEAFRDIGRIIVVCLGLALATNLAFMTPGIQ